MRVSKWGNSLAVRLPVALVEALGLCEGDEIEIDVADRRRDEALEVLRSLGWTLPPDYRSSREAANDRDR